MHSKQVLSLLSQALLAASATAQSSANATKSILFSGGTIVAFNRDSESLEVIRNGSVLVTGDRIASVSSGTPPSLPANTEQVDITDKIITTGFVDTHRHGWQTAFKTLGSNTSLIEYFNRYGEFASEFYNLTTDDVYYGQLAGLYEALNAGVTTTLDHAHHTWSNATAEAGLKASVDSGARVFWAYVFHQLQGFPLDEQFANYRDIAARGDYKGTPTSLGVAYDSFGPNPNIEIVNTIIDLIRESNASVLTTHAVQGPWGVDNSPEQFHALQILNISTPIVFSHASFISASSATLLRQTNQFISITPESEMHYGHGHPTSHLIQDQAALGVDTHFTFSTDILTQARLWLQTARKEFYNNVLARWEVPVTNPMSAGQAFLLATRNGGRALRRDDLGVLAEGAKADLVVWDGTSPALLGWNDPVAAVILHASVADVEHVLVDGKWKKRDGKIVEPEYAEVKKKFLESARRIQGVLVGIDTPLPTGGTFPQSGYEYGFPKRADVQNGTADGYGAPFLEA